MTHDPTITIAGLRAQVDSLETSLRGALDDVAAGEEVRLICEAEHAAVAAERTALAAQLAEVRAELAAAPKGCAIHSYEHGPGPCMTCGAWPPGTRELIAACQARIAGLEQAADERSKEVTRLTAGRTEWIGAAVAVGELVDHLGPVAGNSGEIDPREWIRYAQGLAGRVKARLASLTARVAELEARPVLTEGLLRGALFACADGASDDEVRAIMDKLGPVTLPAQDAAAAIVAAMQRHGWWCSQDSGDGRCEADMRSALASLGAPPTSPAVAPPEVFAGVSVEDLCSAYNRGCNDNPADRPRINGLRAVLARLEVSLVAPVDPEAVARQALRPIAVSMYSEVVKRSAENVRAHLLAAGIPVTPERGK